MEHKGESKDVNLKLEIAEIEELEAKVAPDGSDTVLPLAVHIRH